MTQTIPVTTPEQGTTLGGGPGGAAVLPQGFDPTDPQSGTMQDWVAFLQYTGGQQGLDKQSIDQNIRDWFYTRPEQEQEQFSEFLGIPYTPYKPPGLTAGEQFQFNNAGNTARFSRDATYRGLDAEDAYAANRYGYDVGNVREDFRRGRDDIRSQFGEQRRGLRRGFREARDQNQFGANQRGIAGSGIAGRAQADLRSDRDFTLGQYIRGRDRALDQNRFGRDRNLANLRYGFTEGGDRRQDTRNETGLAYDFGVGQRQTARKVARNQKVTDIQRIQ